MPIARVLILAPLLTNGEALGSRLPPLCLRFLTHKMKLIMPALHKFPVLVDINSVEQIT